MSEDQTCIPGRNIAKKLHTLNDVIRYGNSKNIEAVILFLDQEKAFDRVSHEFLLKTLRHLNFGDYFVSWVQIMLKDVTSQIKVNGFLTGYRYIPRCKAGRSTKCTALCSDSRGPWQPNKIKSKHKGNNNSRYRAKDFTICR